MGRLALQYKNFLQTHVYSERSHANNNEVLCDWGVLRKQLLEQWSELSERELDATGHNRGRIARLIQRKYGIRADMADNYLCNFERTLPMVGCA